MWWFAFPLGDAQVAQMIAPFDLGIYLTIDGVQFTSATALENADGLLCTLSPMGQDLDFVIQPLIGPDEADFFVQDNSCILQTQPIDATTTWIRNAACERARGLACPPNDCLARINTYRFGTPDGLNDLVGRR